MSWRFRCATRSEPTVRSERIRSRLLSSETCEERLVLSGQALIDVVAELGQLAEGSTPIEPQLNEAHVASGLNSVVEQFGLTGEGQTVAVIDSGIAWDHVALGQGYGPGYRVVGGWDFAESDDQPYDDGPSGFHGTHVSGVIGSEHSDNPGVAPDVDLVSLRVFNDAGQGQLDWVENALRWVHDNQNTFENPITTVNISVGALDGGQALSLLSDELQQLYNDGIIVTASAGNSFRDLQETGLSYPASSVHVLPVASVDADGNLSDFSQRDSRVLAAPGEAINSSVPDHVLGRDGRVDDFTGSSGTSMASPYVAGASVLVRQAMEMSGVEQIDSDSILNHLRSTADSVFDTVTGQSYDRLNLEEAISSLIPRDVVSDSLASGETLDFAGIQQGTGLDTWINQLQDRDVYQFTADESGRLHLDASSEWNSTFSWTLSSGGQDLASAGLEAASVDLVAGQRYDLLVFSHDTIGPGTIEFAFDADSSGTTNQGSHGGETEQGSSGAANGNSTEAFNSLGTVDYLRATSEAGTSYSAIAADDGIFSIVWNNPDAASGSLVATHAGSNISTGQWSEGSLRLDLEVTAGQQVQFQLPGNAGDSGEFTVANLLQKSGASLIVSGTGGQDSYSVDLRGGLNIEVGGVEYVFGDGEVQNVRLDGGGSGDEIYVQGSDKIESVELRPGEAIIENQRVHLGIQAVEDVTFSGGGNTDRIYMYDSDGDDTLRASPEMAELAGVGYRFEVNDVSRIFVHATGSGEDLAYVYDSAGDDQLSARPQFTSIKGEGYFNYVRGFERVYAYANAGGHDTAALYDSDGADRFSAAGDSALISGPGFSSHVRGFEDVAAHAHAGGLDRATLYGTSDASNWYQGASQVSFQEGSHGREAHGFETVEAFENSRPISIAQQSLHSDGLSAIREAAFASEAERSGVNTRLIPELGIYAQTLSLSEVAEESLKLPDANLLIDEDQEQELLHEVFSRFGDSDG